MTTPLTRNMRDGQILVKDGASGSITLDTDEGSLSWEEGNDPRVIKQRGALSHLRSGDEEPCKGSFSVKVSKIRGDDTGQGGTDTAGTMRDAFRKEGLCNAWTTTGAAGEPHQVKLVFNIANPDTTGRREVVTFGKVPCPKFSFKEGEEFDTLDVTFIDNETAPTITHEAQ